FVVGTAGCLREKAMVHARTLILILSFAVPAAFAAIAQRAAADDARALTLDAATHARCLEVLREGLAADDFWPSIHAAEGLTLGGYGEEVIAVLTPKLASETD